MYDNRFDPTRGGAQNTLGKTHTHISKTVISWWRESMDFALVWFFVSVGGKLGPSIITRTRTRSEVKVTATSCTRTGAKTKPDRTRLPSATTLLLMQTSLWESVNIGSCNLLQIRFVLELVLRGVVFAYACVWCRCTRKLMEHKCALRSCALRLSVAPKNASRHGCCGPKVGFCR